MPQSHYEEILLKIHSLQDQLEQEIDQLITEKCMRLKYRLKKEELFLIRKFVNFLSTNALEYGLIYGSRKYHLL